MRNHIPAVALLAVIPLVLVGCTSANTSKSSTAHETITYVTRSMTADVKKVWEDTLIKPFEKKYPNITLDFQPIADEDTAIKVRLASGNGPDMFLTDAFNIATYAKAGSLLKLDKYVKQYGLDKIVFPWAMKSAQFNGGQYAIPLEYEGSALFWNNDMLKSFGLTPPKTREEFVHACDVAAAHGTICIAYGDAGLPLLNQWLYEHYLTTYSGAADVKALMTGKAKFTDPKIKGAFELLNQDWQSGYWNQKNSAGINITSSWALWFTGKSLLIPTGTYMGPALVTANPKFSWGAGPWPSMKKGVPAASGLGGHVIAVSSTTKHPDAVMKFLDFLYTQPKKLTGQAIAGGLEPRPYTGSASELPANIDPNAKQMAELVASIAKDPNTAHDLPWSFYPPQTNNFLMNNLDAVFYGKMSLDDYLSQAQVALDGELAAGFKYAGS